jgi:hypothetical protein
VGCVFISHIEEDQSLALEIAAGLEAAGFETWYYERDSEPGLSYLIQVHEAIERCVAFVLLISPNSIKSHQMTKEVVRANDLGKPFVPVRYKISHAVFQEEQPEWNIAIGAAASIPIPEKGVSEILPRIVRGLEGLTSSREDDDREPEPPIKRKSIDDALERDEDSVTWLEAAQAWTKRHRFPVAGSAAMVLVLIYLAQLPDPLVPSQAEPPASVALTPNAAPKTQPTTAPAVSNVPTGVIEAQRPDPGAGNGAVTPATGRATPARTNPAVQPSSTGTGRRTTAPRPTTTAPSPTTTAPSPTTTALSTTTTQPPTANNPVAETPRRPAPDDGGVVTRLPVSPVNAPAPAGPPAAAPPPANAAIIPQTPTAAALVNQAIEEYEKAAESLDLGEVRRVWPAAPEALRVSYRNLRSQAVNLECGEPAIASDTATVSCREQIRSVGAGGITLPVANNTARFVLRRSGGAWQISSISRGN